MKARLFERLESLLPELALKNIPQERMPVLYALRDYMQSKINRKEDLHLVFICTHNSRRSHMAQVWAQALAYYFGVPGVYSYSGGTESTALYPMVIETLTHQGFEICRLSSGDNPVYSIRYASNPYPVIGFSKPYSHAFNPRSGFAAIMTCHQADEDCPFIAGAETRIALSYEDPKAFDATPREAEKYLERSIQIATELYAVFSPLQIL